MFQDNAARLTETNIIFSNRRLT